LWWLILIYVLIFWLYYERIIFAEEAYLRDKFGNEYLDWANQTPLIIPRFRHYRRPDVPFSSRKVLRREYNGFFAVIVTLFIFETVGEIFAEGKLDYDVGWVLILVIGFIAWLTLRVLKKRTNILTADKR
jgi:hypothetical protein